MSPENAHKLMGFYNDEKFNTRRYTLVHGFCFINPLPTDDAHMRHGLSTNLYVAFNTLVRFF